MSIAFGLDFGTTNSVLAIAQGDKVEVIDLEGASELSKTLKSVLFFDEEKNVEVGEEAIRQYVAYGGSYGRFMQSVKAFLPDESFSETYVYGKRYEIEDLIAFILRVIKHQGELHVGHVVDTVVMGRPVIFSDDRKLDLLAEERLRTAALRSGFTNIHFVYEPIAATLAYEAGLPDGKEQLVLMGDFGGGTSDFVVMRLRGGKRDSKQNRDSDILATGGVYVAGDSFDSSIMWHKLARYFGKEAKIHGMSTGQVLDAPTWIAQTLCQWHLIPKLRERKTLNIIRSLRGVSVGDRLAFSALQTLIIENLGYMVFRVIERAKRELSETDSAVIQFSEKNIFIREVITREEFEAIADDKFQEISACVDRTLARAGVSSQDIDAVLLTGGSSFIPKIRRIFLERFGEGKLLPIDAFTSVAYGLGLSATQY